MKHSKKQTPKKANAVKPTIARPAPIVKNEVPVLDDKISAKKFRKIFFISLTAMLAIIWISGYDVGYHMDEMDMNNYCKTNYAFYFNHGNDTSFRNAGVSTVATVRGIRKDTLLRYYGSAFDYLPVGFNKITGLDKSKNEFNVRHIFNQFFAILCILFAGLTTVKITGWRAAIFVQWLLFLTPVFFGHALFNTKDIPFCTGFVASLYFIILFLEELPRPSWKTTLFLMLSFAFTTGIRIGGLMLVFYLFLFIAFYFITKKVSKEAMFKNILPISVKIFVLFFGGLFIVVVTWPFLLSNPLKNIPATIDLVNKFPLKVPLPFEGNFISSLTVPYYYLPKFMSITIPVFIIICFFLSPFIIFRNKQLDRRIILIILFASVFPVVYTMMKHVALYSAWRHFLFVYPGIVIVAGVTLNEIMNRIRTPVLQKAFLLVCCLAMLHPVVWSIQNHPYEYTYFNEAEGGFKNANTQYETDYWEITVKESIDWLFKNEPINKSKDSVYIASNTSLFADYYIHRHFPYAKVRVIDGGFKNRSFTGWTYGIFNTIFLPENLTDFDFPPQNSIHTADIDNIPITTVIKDSTRYDAIGLYYFYKYDFGKADTFLHLSMQKEDKNNTGLLGYLGIIKALKGDQNAAIDLGKRSLEFDKYNYAGYLAVGLAQLFSNKYKEAFPYLAQAYALSMQSNLNIFGGRQRELVVGLFQRIDPGLLKKLEADMKAAEKAQATK